MNRCFHGLPSMARKGKFGYPSDLWDENRKSGRLCALPSAIPSQVPSWLEGPHMKICMKLMK
jgi:hypothetical protein